MSNRIPHIENTDEDTPYCIWHPNTALEATYREVAHEYPHMRYQVGRACAVAGYTELFLELNLRPDAHIAEEAREAGHMAIYDHIMAQQSVYSIMDDYNRTVNSATPDVSCLNGDTAVCSSLDSKQAFTEATVPEIIDGEEFPGFLEDAGYVENTFDITEDMCIDVTTSEGPSHLTAEAVARRKTLISLLTEPLPTHLPTVDKDLLICMAAYNGDIDRYTRLRRPKMVEGELQCCVRGIYHNTMFAIWWLKQALPADDEGALSKAICARFIMNNVLSKVSSDNLPYLIWYPTIAAPTTYRKLARIAPQTIPQVLRACIVADYVDLFDELSTDAIPDDTILNEAALSPNRNYEEALLARVAVVGKRKIEPYEEWKRGTHRELNGSAIDVHMSRVWLTPSTHPYTFYNGHRGDVSRLELLACLPEEWRIGVDDEDTEKDVDYIDHPSSGRCKMG